MPPMKSGAATKSMDEDVQTFVVSLHQAGQRLDRFLSSLMSASRSHIKLLIEHDRVRVQGMVRKAGYLLHVNDAVEVRPLPTIPTAAIPQEIPLSILYEDKF